MNQTPNYQLSQWEATDRVQRTDFNADNAKIDAALAEKADSSALNALSQTVAGHTAALAGKGNCRIWTTTYTGNDLYGVNNPCTLNFPGKPLVVFLGECGAGYNNTGLFACLLRGQDINYAQSHFYSVLTLTWGENSLSWYNHASAVNQLNSKDYTYRVVALMEA